LRVTVEFNPLNIETKQHSRDFTQLQMADGIECRYSSFVL